MHFAYAQCKQKGLVPILIVLLIAIVLGIGGYFVWSNYSKVQSQPPQHVQPTQTPAPPQDPTANWKTYIITPDSSSGFASYEMKLPTNWKQIEHSSNFQGTETFQDAKDIYILVIEEQKNYNNKTGKPFTDFKEITGLSYDTPINVSQQQGTQSLPRAASEYIYQALFFSRDKKLVYSMTLNTPSDGSKISEGKVLFDQILSTFKFNQ